ncbi:MAG: tryptophan 7-halogenase [Oscillatoriaceae cyanobacterium Prado104]|jgi:flavin-dependent dehydrogenase|nr:tryptophan 7-halogenase [Oscillatoriaceae cyanobacterium Prado104]
MQNHPETQSSSSIIDCDRSDIIDADIIVLGSSISGLMAATYLKQKLPELEVIVVGPKPEAEKRAYVGESLTEISIHFFWEIGFKDYLDRTHDLKNGLTFYHKLRIDDPADYRYSVHAPGQSLHFLSRQLNRPIFDRDLRQHAAQSGVKFMIGKAKDFVVGKGGDRHQLSVKTSENKLTHLSSRWIVDASGQKRFIGKKVTTYTCPETGQRSAFWFRLANFEPFLPQLEISQRRPSEYNLWQSTHHFMGHGNWIWCIPLKTIEHDRLISVGISYRPDLYSHSMRSMEDFLAAVDCEHPAVAQMVRSGEVLDTHNYHNYLYSADEIYSETGWFLIGNSARMVDPLYSTGLAMTAIQIQQVTEIIQGKIASNITPQDIANLSFVWRQIAMRRQIDITDQYATMHDPFVAHLRRYWNLNGWWNAILPLWWSGFLTDPRGANILCKLLEGDDRGSKSAAQLFEAVSAKLGNVEQSDFDRTIDFDRLINRRFDRSISTIPLQLARYFQWRLQIRWRLLSLGGWQLLPSQLRSILQEFVRMLLSKYLFGYLNRDALREIKLSLDFDFAGAVRQDKEGYLSHKNEG